MSTGEDAWRTWLEVKVSYGIVMAVGNETVPVAPGDWLTLKQRGFKHLTRGQPYGNIISYET